MTHGDECGITLALERVRSVQPLAFIWAHFLRLYLTCCSLRYGVSSARIRIGFPADILQETAVHQSRGKEKERGRRRNEEEARQGDSRGDSRGGWKVQDWNHFWLVDVKMRSVSAKSLTAWLSISRSETLVKLSSALHLHRVQTWVVEWESVGSGGREIDLPNVLLPNVLKSKLVGDPVETC